MKKKNITGRPRVSFDKRVFEKLCALQCTLSEIANFMGLSGDTIERRCKEVYEKPFAEVFALKRGGGHTSLRRAQFRMAQTNPTMAIWLGKQYLGQTDKVDVRVEDVDAAIERELARVATGSQAANAEQASGETVH